MKKVLVLAFIAIAFCFSACKEAHVTPINPLAKALFAPGGNDSKWDYTDLRATNPDDRVFSVSVSDYEAYENDCEEKKVTSEAISYKLGGQQCTVYSNSCIEDNTAYIKVAIPHADPLVLKCDANGNFDCKAYEYLETYDLLGITYNKVHHFTVELASAEVEYWFAENIGLVYAQDNQGKVCLKLTGHTIY